jgi:hypothetical protein
MKPLPIVSPGSRQTSVTALRSILSSEGFVDSELLPYFDGRRSDLTEVLARAKRDHLTLNDLAILRTALANCAMISTLRQYLPGLPSEESLMQAHEEYSRLVKQFRWVDV